MIDFVGHTLLHRTVADHVHDVTDSDGICQLCFDHAWKRRDKPVLLKVGGHGNDTPQFEASREGIPSAGTETATIRFEAGQMFIEFDALPS